MEGEEGGREGGMEGGREGGRERARLTGRQSTGTGALATVVPSPLSFCFSLFRSFHLSASRPVPRRGAAGALNAAAALLTGSGEF